MAESQTAEESTVPTSITVLPSQLLVIDLAARLQQKSRAAFMVELSYKQALEELRARGIDPDRLSA